MSQKNLQPPRGNKPLLPAVDLKEGSESGEQAGSSGAGGPSKEGGKLPKRSKVTAVACQPCQKRKSKCDGVRPICSSCAQKGRADCVYDSASDQRRTSALKQRIEGLQLENDALKDIISSICLAYDSHNAEPTIRLVQQTLQQGDFSRVPELAEVLRKNTQAMASQSNAPYHAASGYEQGSQFAHPQQMAYSFMGPNPSMMREETQLSPRTGSGQSEWSSGHVVSSEDQDEEMTQQRRYQGGGAYMYPQ